MKGKTFPLFGVLVFCVAAYLFQRALRAYDPAEIVQSILAISAPRLALAALFGAASYLTLTLFDALAVRYVGARLPYRRVALASFSALSIGHTLGLAAASTGAVRYRFYSRWGIGGEEIAKIILFCAMTAGLGLNTLMGLALWLQAGVAAEFLGFSRRTALTSGAACLLLTALYLALAAVLRRPLKVKRREVAMPPPGLALAQVVVGCLNFCFVAAALHQMLPPGTAGYFTVAAVYVLGNVAGMISHAPGGLGVLEGVVLHLMPQASVIGALVVFRVVYYLIPFVIGTALCAGYELAQRRRAAAARAPGVF